MKKKIFSLSLGLLSLCAVAQTGPTYQWVKGMGSTGSEIANNVTVDVSGNVYTTGTFEGTVDFNPGAGVFNLTSNGSRDIFITKLDGAGNFLWAKSIGGTGDDVSSGIDLDGSSGSNLGFTGSFQNTVDFDPGAGTTNVTSAGGWDIFVCKLNRTTGNLVMVKTAGNAGNDIGTSLVLDGTFNIFVTGSFGFTVDFDPSASTSNLTSAGSSDAFVWKLDGTGNFLWAKQFGGTGSDYASSITPDGTYLFIGGYFDGSGDFDPGVGVTTLTPAGLTDAFVVSLNGMTGALNYAKSFGGIGQDVTSSVAAGGAGTLVFTGYFSGTVDFDPSASVASLSTVSTGQDIYVAKLDINGDYIWAKSFVGTATYANVSNKLAIDGDNAIYVTGYFDGTVDFDPSTVNTYSFSTLGYQEIFLTKLTTNGDFAWAQQFGAGFYDAGNDLFIDASSGTNDVFLCGYYSSTVDFDISAATATLTSLGTNDAFLLKLNGCLAPASPTDVTPTANLTVCNGAPSYLSASGTGSLTWYTSATGGTAIATGTLLTTPPVISNTTYYVQSTLCGPSNLRTAITVSVNGTAQPVVSLNSGTICAGKSFTMVPTGATSYTYSSGTSIVSPTTTTNYTVTGSNSIGCKATATNTVVVNALPIITASSTNSIVCSGSSVTLTGSGGTTYTWTSGVTNGVAFIPSSTLSYTVTGASAGCTNKAVISVSVNPTPIISPVASPTAICDGSTATLTAGGPITTYTWSTGANTSSISVNPTTTTTYSINGIGSNGCVALQKTITVTVTTAPTVAVNSGTICAGKSFTMTGSGANTYAYSGGSSIVSPTSNTNYTVIGTSVSGCTNTAVSSITVIALPTISSSVTNSVICDGASTTLSGAGGLSYVWTGGVTDATAFSPTTTTAYTVTGTDFNGCTNTSVKTITVNPIPVISVPSSTICSGATTILTASGANTYTWSTSATTSTISVMPTSTTTYTVDGTSAAGCVATSVTTTVTLGSAPSIAVLSSSICAGSSATLTASGVTTYTWSTGATSPSIIVTPVVNTTYTVSGNLTGCGVGATNTATVSVNPTPTVSAVSSNPLICSGETATLTASGATTYSWSSGSAFSTETVSPTTTTTYTVAGVDNLGCTGASVITQSVSLCTSLNELNNNGALSIYPNPTNGILNVTLGSMSEKITIQITNALGQVLINENVTIQHSTFNLAHLPTGMYFVNVIENSRVIKTQKIVKQ